MLPEPEVSNQVAALEDDNLFDGDTVLRDAVQRHGAGWHAQALSAYGGRLGNSATIRLGELANRHPPELRTHDRCGNRLDSVDFHPAWSSLLDMLYVEGVHCLPWESPRPGAHVARAAAFFLHGQIEAGTLCPVTMTFAAMPLLMRESALFARWRDQLFHRAYDGRDLPIAHKRSLTIGMGMTEKQGGSDLRANTTQAHAVRHAGRGETYRLAGHKWFFSAPTSDAHVVLANAPEGLSCFLVPRWRADDGRNGVHLSRLKDKLGNRSNASAEVELEDAEGTLIGEPGRGIATIIEMAAQTRLDCVLGSAALMRQALVQALHHARHRSAFGRPLVEQPLMRSVLVDLALDSEAATRLALRLAAARGRLGDDPLERALWRIVTPAAKFWICKRAIAATAECMEVLGGNGYIEDWPLARLYREAPVNSIWEGAGNIVCLDMLRGIAREPESAVALLDFLNSRTGAEPALGGAIREFVALLDQAREAREAQARRGALLLTLAVQAILLMDEAPPAVAELFVMQRLRAGGAVFGAAGAPIGAALAEAVLAGV